MEVVPIPSTITRRSWSMSLIQPPVGLELVDDEFGDDTHKVLDEEVLQNLTRAPEDIEMIALLTMIVDRSQGRLDSRYRAFADAQALYENPELKKLLTDAWAQKSFATIRKLSA